MEEVGLLEGLLSHVAYPGEQNFQEATVRA
jgi:hypothetical protein